MQQFENENIIQENEDKIIISDYLQILKNKWYWFVISVGICCCIVLLYIAITPNVYKRQAQIMIKEETKMGGIGEAAILKEMNLFSGNANVNNEVELLRSRHLINEVIDRLHLDVSYKVRHYLKKVELYRSSPIQVKFLQDEEEKGISFVAKFISKDEVWLSEFETEDIYSSTPIKVHVFDTVETPIGKVVVSPTLYYNSDYDNVPIYVTKSASEQSLSFLLKNLDVQMNKNNTIITLSINDQSIIRAEDILNTLVSVYNEDNIKYKNQVVVNTSDFINERLGVIGQELGSVDTAISTFKSKNMVTDLALASELFLTESATYNQQIFELENQLSVAKFIKEYLTNPTNNDNLIPANTGIEDKSVEDQVAEYNTLLLKRFRLIENGSDKSPAVIEVTNALTAVKQSVIRSIDNLIIVLDLQIKGIKNRESRTNQRISDVPETQREMISIERKLKIQENLYLFLLQKREENELAGAVTTSNFRIVDEAGGLSIPVAPKKSILLLVAMIMGLVIPVAILWLQEMLNNTIRGQKEITDNLTVPFLGTIPQGEDKKSSKGWRRFKKKKVDKEDQRLEDVLILKDNGRDPISEAFRVVRANMDFINAKKHKVIMFTSYNVDSGKTFTSLNLAMSFALRDKKVLVVDLDLRKATVSSSIDSPKVGVSAYLNGSNTNLQELIVKTEQHANLDILPVGVLPPNPAELLLDDQFKKLIEELKENYDYIFLDTTPVNIVADASIVNGVSDITIFVVREGLLDRRLLPEIENFYKTNKFNNMTVLLNGSHSISGRYGSRYGYGYGYGYGNGYHRK